MVLKKNAAKEACMKSPDFGSMNVDRYVIIIKGLMIMAL